MAKGRAYLALQCDDGEVRPVYLLLDREGFAHGADPGNDPVMAKDLPVEESPGRWPMSPGAHNLGLAAFAINIRAPSKRKAIKDERTDRF